MQGVYLKLFVTTVEPVLSGHPRGLAKGGRIIQVDCLTEHSENTILAFEWFLFTKWPFNTGQDNRNSSSGLSKG